MRIRGRHSNSRNRQHDHQSSSEEAGIDVEALLPMKAFVASGDEPQTSPKRGMVLFLADEAQRQRRREKIFHQSSIQRIWQSLNRVLGNNQAQDIVFLNVEERQRFENDYYHFVQLQDHSYDCVHQEQLKLLDEINPQDYDRVFVSQLSEDSRGFFTAAEQQALNKLLDEMKITANISEIRLLPLNQKKYALSVPELICRNKQAILERRKKKSLVFNAFHHECHEKGGKCFRAPVDEDVIMSALAHSSSCPLSKREYPQSIPLSDKNEAARCQCYCGLLDPAILESHDQENVEDISLEKLKFRQDS